MTQPTITNTQMKIEIDTVGSVFVTAPSLDSNGNSVREVRVFGITDADNPFVPLVFTLRLSSPTPGNILIATPATTF